MYVIVSFSCISAFDCFNNNGINWADKTVIHRDVKPVFDTKGCPIARGKQNISVGK